MTDTEAAIAAFIRNGGKVTVGRTRKAVNSRTFGWKGGVTQRGRKTITIRDSVQYVRG